MEGKEADGENAGRMIDMRETGVEGLGGSLSGAGDLAASNNVAELIHRSSVPGL